MSYTREDIHQIVLSQKQYFRSGETLNIKFRIEQLKKLRKALFDYELEIEEALKQDLNRSYIESYFCDIGSVVLEINEYIKGKYIVEDERVNEQDDIELEIMLNLRTNRGLDLDKFKNKYGYDLYFKKQVIIDKNINNGYLFIKDKHLIPTYEGMMVLDQIILDLI